MRARAAAIVLALLAPACLVQRAQPDATPPVPTHEMRRTYYAGASGAPDTAHVRDESQVLVWPGGRVERDGVQREFAPDGTLLVERHFENDRPAGRWRTWYADGKPRSEVDFGERAAPDVERTWRFWHASGQLAAEGTARAGLREGAWTFWDEQGGVLREGGYRAGLREGDWTFYESGAKRAQGAYRTGHRVGAWTLWDEHGAAHSKSASDVDPGALGRDDDGP